MTICEDYWLAGLIALFCRAQLGIMFEYEIVREYDQEIPQLQTWHWEEEPHNNYETPGRQTKQSNQLSLPHQDDCTTRMDIK